MEVVAARIPALGVMLTIAGVALLLGLAALWLARRRTHRDRREHESKNPPPGP